MRQDPGHLHQQVQQPGQLRRLPLCARAGDGPMRGKANDSHSAAYPALTRWARLLRACGAGSRNTLGFSPLWQRDVAVLRLYVRDLSFPQDLAETDRLKAVSCSRLPSAYALG